MTNSRASILLVVSSAAALVAFSSCSKDKTKLPKDAGEPTQGCVTMGSVPGDPAATFHRATWKTKVVDEHADKILAVLAVTTTFADVAGSPYGQKTCVEVSEVSKDVAIVADLRPAYIGGGSSAQPSAIQVSAYLTIRGPARVKDDVVLNHPEGSLAWTLNVRATGIDVATNAAFTERHFNPPWREAKLSTRDDTTTLEPVARP